MTFALDNQHTWRSRAEVNREGNLRERHAVRAQQIHKELLCSDMDQEADDLRHPRLAVDLGSARDIPMNSRRQLTRFGGITYNPCSALN
jgi:hypothetical protein